MSSALPPVTDRIATECWRLRRRRGLAALEARLDPDRFVRIHRSAIVQVDRIAETRAVTHGDAEVVLRDGARLTASRTWRTRLRTALRLRATKDLDDAL